MKLNYHRENNLSYIIIDEFFTAEELEKVIVEVKELEDFSLTSEDTGTAKDAQENLKKDGKGIFLDDFYGLKNKPRESSAILTANRKLFDPKFMALAKTFDSVFGFLEYSNNDCTLLNYYGKGQQYKPHKDNSRISAVTFLQIGDFSGGEFSFPEQKITIESLHNRTVIFPSCVIHCAMPMKGSGRRISIAQFVDFIDC